MRPILQKRREMNLDDLWAGLRQGARNVAGVTWQVNVCAYLLVAARAGQLPFVELTPEGREDADCIAADGTRSLVQIRSSVADKVRLAIRPFQRFSATQDKCAGEQRSRPDRWATRIRHFLHWLGSVLGDQSGGGIARVRTGIISRGFRR